MVDPEDTHGPLDGEFVARLVLPQIRHHMPGLRILLAHLGRHEPPRQGRETRRGEEVEGVPGVLPGAARRGLSVEDGEVHTEAAQVIADGESGLSATDDHYLCAPVAHHEVWMALAV